MPKMKGIMSASPTFPPNPGTAPKKLPSKVANSISNQIFQLNNSVSPAHIECSIACPYLLFFPGKTGEKLG